MTEMREASIKFTQREIYLDYISRVVKFFMPAGVKEDAMAVNQGTISWQSCRNVVIGGRRTNLRLENAYWSSLKDICEREGFTLNELCGEIERRRGSAKLTQALRRFVVDYYRRAAPAVTTQAAPLLDTVLDTLF